MSHVLITGASGLIGRALAERLTEHHDVVCLGRRQPEARLRHVRGEFGAFEDLRQLDGVEVDVLVHLAAVTGGCLERDGILVNVEGTRCLMRYLMDRGCRKFVMASSIAAVGFQSTRFRPLQLPIPDEHPCLDRDGYGLSKYLMEEVTRYCQRQREETDVINLRLATVLPDESMPEPVRAGPLREWSLGGITLMALTDAVRAFELAAQAPLRPGVRILNAAPRRAWVADPMACILRTWWQDEVDVSWYEQAGHEYDSAYDVTAITRELGFGARLLPHS